MDRHVAVPLLETIVLLDVMQIVSSDDDRTLHLHLLDSAGQDATTDRDIAGEGALFVDVSAFNSLARQKILRLKFNSCKLIKGNIMQQTSAQHHAGYWTYLSGGFEAKTNSLVVPQTLLSLGTFPVKVDGGLLLEGFLVLCGSSKCKDKFQVSHAAFNH